MGRHKMEVWYQSPYPDDAARLPKLYLCEFCLRYQKSEITMKRHAAKCVWRHPPGDEVLKNIIIIIIVIIIIMMMMKELFPYMNLMLN